MQDGMTDSTTLKVFDVQGYSINDGPGIRQTIFLQGCPLKCLWCHSPESQSFEGRILWLGAKCVGCLSCVAACPTGARSLEEPIDASIAKGRIICDWEKCTKCGNCEKACLSKALYYSGTDRSIAELMRRIEQERPFYDKSGGGVTVSGGEALCQADGVAELLKRCKDVGISTAVDTCGFVPWQQFEKVLPYTDIFLYDIKAIDSERHLWATAVRNELIIENLKKLAAAKARLHIRLPLIPNFNTGTEDIVAIKNLLLEIKEAVELVQLLPYHNLGTAKYDRLGASAPELDTFVPGDDMITSIANIFEEADFKVIIH
jgi:pyruvate formate lyase activating enzyme